MDAIKVLFAVFAFLSVLDNYVNGQAVCRKDNDGDDIICEPIDLDKGIAGCEEDVVVRRGNLDMILAVPHGGMCSNFPYSTREFGCPNGDRCAYNHDCYNDSFIPRVPEDCRDGSCCITGANIKSDFKSNEVAYRIYNSILEKTKRCPSIIVSMPHRSFLDVNRYDYYGEASFGEEVMKTIYKRYHDNLTALVADLNGRPGFLFDLHGQAKKDWTMIGTMMSAYYLRNSTRLNSNAERSSLKRLVTRTGENLSDLLQGLHSLGKYIEDEIVNDVALDAVPSDTNPDPGLDPFYAAQYSPITKEHRDNINVLQIEMTSDGRKKYQASYSLAIGEAFLKFYERYIDGCVRYPCGGTNSCINEGDGFQCTCSNTGPCPATTCTGGDAATGIQKADLSPNKASYKNGECTLYTCQDGYEYGSGNLSRVCEDGSWSGTAPICAAITCPTVDIANAERYPLKDSYDYNDDVTYTCTTGYKPNDIASMTRTCSDSGWSGAKPACTAITCPAVDIANAERSPDKDSYDNNDTITYTCKTGYKPVDTASMTITCAVSGWTGFESVCTAITCPTVDIANAVRFPHKDSYDYNDDVTYTCATGYKPDDIASMTRTCSDSGWSGAEPACTAITCPAVDIANAKRSPDKDSYDNNDNITYTCTTGYKPVDTASMTRTCSVSGWTGSEPVCTAITCPTVDIANAVRSPHKDSYDYNDDVTYTCATRYKPDDIASMTRTCSDSGWSGAEPACTAITCPAVDIANAKRSPDKDSYDNNDNITYTCTTGYKPVDTASMTRTCSVSGWTGSEPVCTAITCPAVDIANAVRSPHKVSYDYNDDVIYTCATGYKPDDIASMTRTCSDSGWSGAEPACTAITCPAVYIANAERSPYKDSYDDNDNITYTCTTGHKPVETASMTRTCSVSGWTGSEPVCTAITCPAVDILNAVRSPHKDSYDYNDDVTYTCATGYKPDDIASMTRMCSDSGWSGAEPACTAITCPAVEIANAERSPDKDSYDNNDNITYTCTTGYKPVDTASMTRTCSVSGWTGSEPVCTAITCSAVDIANAERSPDKDPYDFNDDVTYTCVAGYKPDDTASMTRTCSDSGWSGSQPACTAITCPAVDIANAERSPDKDSYGYNDDVTYTCETGYISSEPTSMTRTCFDSGWSGHEPECIGVQNIAFNKTTKQKGNNFGNSLFWPGNAVDGDYYNTCSQTKKTKKPWWRVNLGGWFTVKTVVIVPKENGDELHDLVVYVKPKGKTNTICGTYKGPAAPGENINVQCDPPVVGKRVTIKMLTQGKKEILVLCEVVVIGTSGSK